MAALDRDAHRKMQELASKNVAKMVQRALSNLEIGKLEAATTKSLDYCLRLFDSTYTDIVGIHKALLCFNQIHLPSLSIKHNDMSDDGVFQDAMVQTEATPTPTLDREGKCLLDDYSAALEEATCQKQDLEAENKQFEAEIGRLCEELNKLKGLEVENTQLREELSKRDCSQAENERLREALSGETTAIDNLGAVGVENQQTRKEQNDDLEAKSQEECNDTTAMNSQADLQEEEEEEEAEEEQGEPIGQPQRESRDSQKNPSRIAAQALDEVAAALGDSATNLELLQALVADGNITGARTLTLDLFFAAEENLEFVSRDDEAKHAIIMRAFRKAEADIYARASSLPEYAEMAWFSGEEHKMVWQAVLDALSSDAVREVYSNVSDDEASELWPYEKRFDALQAYHIDVHRQANENEASDMMISVLGLLSKPYFKIGELRARAMIDAIEMLEAEDLYATPSFSHRLDDLRRVLKLISHDKKEHPVTRIMALFGRYCDLSASASSKANYIRQALHYAKVELGEIVQYPAVINLAGANGITRNVSLLQLAPESVSVSTISSKIRAIFDCAPEEFRRSCLFELLHSGARSLERLEGPPMSVVVQSDSTYASCVGGGCCDGCGKTPEEAGLSALFKCKQCRLAHYCSPACQSRCWSEGHADCCKKFGRFEVGDAVILQSLRNAAELKGQMALIESRASSGRWVVRLTHPDHVKQGPISVKPENIRHPRPVK